MVSHPSHPVHENDAKKTRKIRCWECKRRRKKQLKKIALKLNSILGYAKRNFVINLLPSNCTCPGLLCIRCQRIFYNHDTTKLCEYIEEKPTYINFKILFHKNKEKC